MTGNVTFNPNYDVPITGTITALNGTVALDLLQKDIQSVSILGTWVATLIFEGSNDGTNWFTLPAIDVSTNSIVFSTTVNGNYLLPSGGLSQTRVKASAFTSGTVNVANEGANEGLAQFVFQNNAMSLSANVIGNVASGTADSGNPVKVGGVYNLTLPTVSNGQRVDAQATLKGSRHVNLRNGSDGTEMIGQKVMASSIPVVFPSDQVITTTASPLPASGSKFAFGDVATASSATQVPVERTTYTEQTTNGQRSIASANAGDASAGTGARTVLLTYYDQTGAGPFTETLTLNGTTGVNTVSTTICFIENIKVLTAGSTGSNIGILTLYTAINKGGTVIGTVAATDNQTLWAHHYVPFGKTCYISGFSINSNSQANGNGAFYVLKAATPTVANSVNLQISDFHHLFGSQSGTLTRTYLSPIVVPGPARVTAYVLPESNVAITQRASFDFIDN